MRGAVSTVRASCTAWPHCDSAALARALPACGFVLELANPPGNCALVSQCVSACWARLSCSLGVGGAAASAVHCVSCAMLANNSLPAVE